MLGAQVLGRAVAVIFNYSMVRRSVFYSQQGHKTVLPKYLALVVASGTCSYLGIQLLSRASACRVIPAKLLVETRPVLRQFRSAAAVHFQASRSGGASGRPAPAEFRLQLVAVAIGVVFAALVALEAFGIRTHNLFSQEIWFPVGWRRFVRYSEYYAVIARHPVGCRTTVLRRIVVALALLIG